LQGLAMSDLPGVLMLDVQGTVLNEDERSLLRHPQVGGVILFSRNIQDAAQVQALVADIRRCRPHILLAVYPPAADAAFRGAVAAGSARDEDTGTGLWLADGGRSPGV
jgi:LmbE family N-acetylglucosaminyl deacetylase